MSLSSAAQRRLDGIRQAIKLYDTLVQEMPGYEETPDAADYLRNLFPEQDDLTLAAFAAYICVNAITGYSSNPLAGEGIFVFGLLFGERTKQLAWSLNTPEVPEPDTKGA